MDTSSLLFMTCDQLREEFDKCNDDINKRILIIDVRHPQLYNRSHLMLDARHNISSIRSKMRVMNIDPSRLTVCTVKNISTILTEEELKVFRKRRDATEVIIIDSNTDNISELSKPKSKVMQVIYALTKFDSQLTEKIIVPVHVLRGGFREWILKYPHFTTDNTYDPDAEVDDFTSPTSKSSSASSDYSPDGSLKSPSVPIPSQAKLAIIPQPSAPPYIPHRSPPIPAQKPKITKPVPTPPKIVVPMSKPNITKNAPGTAVPITPVLSIRPALPRSHSSPNVAQAEGDELACVVSQGFDRLAVSSNSYLAHDNEDETRKNEASPNKTYPTNQNNHHPVPTAPPVTLNKPRFDRNLKPVFNNESLNAIRAQLNFGRSPEASGKAISGLQNLGNTCFMNSVLQCLAYTPGLVNFFCSEPYYNNINFNSQYGSKGELAVEFGSLVDKLNSRRHRYLEPKSFRESVVKHIGFAGNEQQDSHEFMMMLFDKLHHDLNEHAKEKQKPNGLPLQNGLNQNDDNNINIPRATLGYQFWKRHLDLNKSIISDLFEGIFMSTLVCTYCRGPSNTFEVFNCLSLPIPSDSRCHVRDCLAHFSNPERIDAAWECPRCKQKREAEKKIVICKLPRILVIHLKRFSLDGRWRQKLQTIVDFPLTDLNVDCTNVLPQSAYGPRPIKGTYNLCAVVNHYGHLDGGHYTAFCKLENQRWYTFDDSNVSEMKDSDVCGQAAYILFYALTG